VIEEETSRKGSYISTTLPSTHHHSQGLPSTSWPRPCTAGSRTSRCSRSRCSCWPGRSFTAPAPRPPRPVRDRARRLAAGRPRHLGRDLHDAVLRPLRLGQRGRGRDRLRDAAADDRGALPARVGGGDRGGGRGHRHPDPALDHDDRAGHGGEPLHPAAVPGLAAAAVIVGISKMLVIYGRARFFEPTREVVRFRPSDVPGRSGRPLPALAAPVIILGGILTGVFTATEAAAVAVLYATALALAYRTLRLARRAPDPAQRRPAERRRAGAGRRRLDPRLPVRVQRRHTALSDFASQYGRQLPRLRHARDADLLGRRRPARRAPGADHPGPASSCRWRTAAGMAPIHFAIFALAVFGISLVTLRWARRASS